MIYFQILDKKNNKIIAENIQNYPRYLEFEKEKNRSIKKEKIRSGYKEINSIAVWIIAVNESDLANSSKRFNHIIIAYANAANVLLPYYIDKVKAHSHTLRTLQGQMKQKMEGFAQKKNFRGANYAEQKENIEQIISHNTNASADLICYLNKRINEIEAHIEVFDLLYNSDLIAKPIKKKVNIKKVLQNIIAPFMADLSNEEVKISLCIKDDFAEKNTILINYKMFNLALCNFFNNTVKYVKPHSNININFDISEMDSFEITFDMISCRIDQDEKEKIFQDGYSGRNAVNIGDGIGMFAVQRSLETIGMVMTFDADYSCSETYNGTKYIKNLFIIKEL